MAAKLPFLLLLNFHAISQEVRREIRIMNFISTFNVLSRLAIYLLFSFFYFFMCGSLKPIIKLKTKIEQERKTFIRSEAITISYTIVIPENHSSRDETDYVIS